MCIIFQFNFEVIFNTFIKERNPESFNIIKEKVIRFNNSIFKKLSENGNKKSNTKKIIFISRKIYIPYQQKKKKVKK